MNHRYAVALGLFSWLLLMPPLNQAKESDPSAPLKSWRKLSTFERALECESARLATMEAACKNHPDSCELLPYNLLCMKSDDPRLNQD